MPRIDREYMDTQLIYNKGFILNIKGLNPAFPPFILSLHKDSDNK